MPDPRSELLVRSLSRAARDLVDRRSLHDLDQTLAAIVAAAVDTVPGADAGGITLAERDTITSRHPTGDRVHALDDLQASLGEGPCIAAATQSGDDEVVHVPDLAAEDARRRWPRFAPAAVEHGFRALLSTPLRIRQDRRAALNLYSAEPGVFDEAARTLAALFGLQAAVLLYGADHAGHLNRALESRDVIGQAKGILQERFDVDADQAFQMLARSSQDTNMKVVDIAQWLCTHRRDTRPPPGERGAP